MRPLLILVVAVISGRASGADRFDRTTLSIGGSEIVLEVERGDRDEPPRAAVEQWLRQAATAVSAFYGRFPVPRVRVVVARVPGRGIGGTTYGGRLVRMRVGVATPAAALDDDWTMTHELFHLGFPDLAQRHLWIQEGLATYFEPIARARVGDLPAEQVWRDLFSGMRRGMPEKDNGALDDTPTWGATYWGGAWFWFLADIEIREQTGNRRSADTVVRAILAAGGTGAVDWSIDRVLEVGDRATGTTVLRTLYDRMAKRRFKIDPGTLAARLGVGGDRFDDDAPLAAIRRSITAPDGNPDRVIAP